MSFVKNKKIYGLVAFESNTGAMGKKGELPWYLPSDLKHFKNLTKNQTIIMGRKTFDSILNSYGSPLPQRQNIVLSKKTTNIDTYKDVLFVDNIKKALENSKSETIFIIGGGEIFKVFSKILCGLYATILDVHQTDNADTFFPINILDQFSKKETIGEFFENNIKYQIIFFYK